MEEYEKYKKLSNHSQSNEIRKKEKPTIFQKYFLPLVASNELELYLNEPVSNLTRNNEILIYWKINAERFPVLSQMALDYMAIPASSSPVESIFSTAGHLMNKKRSRLRPETLECLLVLHSWQKNQFF